MTAPSIAAALARVAELDAAATKGPWRDLGADEFGDHAVSPDILAVAAVVTNMRPADEVAANAAFIAESRTLLPQMAAEVERLRAENEQMQTLASAKYLDSDCVAAMRSIAHEGLGFNATWVDDDMAMVIGLAQRAVLAGMDADAQPDIRLRFKEAAEKFRARHEASLGFAIAPSAGQERGE